MVIGKGIVIGINFKSNSYYFFLVIVIVKEDRTYCSKKNLSNMEKIKTTANKLGKLADDLQAKLLE